MKPTIQFLSLLLCFELVIGPVRGTSFLLTNAKAEDCSEGMEWSNDLNHCVISKQAIEVQNKVDACGAGDKNCYKDNANKELAEELKAGNVKDKDSFFKDDGEGGIKQKGLVKGMNYATVGIPLIIVTNTLLNKQKLTKEQRASYRCRPASLMLMYGAAAALGVGEIYGYFTHQSRLKNIQKEWDDVVLPKDGSTDQKKVDATEAQSQAFEFLAKNEDEIALTAKTKKGFYLAATGLFAAGALAAGYEMWQLKKAQLDITTRGPAQIAAANAQTPPNTVMAENGKKLIEEGKLTVNKLTCFSGDDKNLEDTDQAIKDNEANQKAIDEKLKDSTLSPEDKAALTKQKADLVNERTGLDKTRENQVETRKKQTDKMNKKNERKANRNKPKTKAQINFNQERMRQVAAYNISTAKDAAQLLELTREHDAIEFENYTKVSYLEEVERDDNFLKEISLPKEVAQAIASTFMPEAHAEGGEKIMGIASMAMPLLLGGGLDKITSILKFQDGKPIDPSQVSAIKKEVSGKVSTAIGKPVTRLAINGVLGTWMGFMTSHMANQQKISQDRAAKLRSIKNDFASAGGLINCSDDDRNDASKPKCFCFTSDNKFNTSRVNTTVCSQALKELDSIVKPLPNVPKVCVNQGMAMDANCKCRSTNTCLKTTKSFSMAGFNPSAFKMINAGAGPADGLFNGVTSAGDITDSATINAARIQKAANDMVAKMDPQVSKQKDNYASGLEKSLIASAGGLSMNGSNNRSPLPSSPAAAASALDKELKENSSDIDVTTAGIQDKGGGGFDSVDEPTPEFGMNGEQIESQDIEIAEVMSQEVDFGSNDIKGSDSNIFEVLSNRYQRSGMRRLFEDQIKTKADEASNTDIVE